jgi:hypothetical protein
MVHSHAAYAAPSDVGCFEPVHHLHHIVRSATCLPIVKLLCGHALTNQSRRENQRIRRKVKPAVITVED